MFTREQILEIQQKLASLGYRDTDFARLSELDGEELVAVVKNGANKITPVNAITRELSNVVQKISLKILDNDNIPRFIKGKVESDGKISYYANIVRLSKSEYDEIETKGANTLYIVYKSGEIDELYLGTKPLTLGKAEANRAILRAEEAVRNANDAIGLITTTIEKADESFIRASNAEDAAENAESYASEIANLHEQLLVAMRSLPDGSAVSAQVAENTAELVIVNALVSSLKNNILDGLKFKVISENDFKVLEDEGRVDSGTVYFRLEEE